MSVSRRMNADMVDLLRWETRFADAYAAALRKYLPLVSAATVPTSLTAAGADELPPDPDQIRMTFPEWQAIVQRDLGPLVEVMMAERVWSIIRETVPEELWPEPGDTAAVLMEKANDAIRRVYALPSAAQFQQDYLMAVTNRMVRTPDSVFDVIRRELDEGMRLGEGTRGLRARVQQALVFGGAEDWRGRAENVARTEMTGAFNGSTFLAAKAQEDMLDIRLDKVWVATMDSRTRDTHFAADGQRRPLDAPFRVGSVDLDYPGDTSGPPAEVVSCRCTFVELEPDQELPPEIDRQTERTPSPHRAGSQKDEINRRAADGVVRARDDDAGEGLVASGREMAMNQDIKWRGVLAALGEATGDGRIILPDAELDFRQFPLPLFWQERTSHGEMVTEGGVAVGVIEKAWVENGQVLGEGYLFGDEDDARQAAKQIERGVTKPSIDMTNDKWTLVDGEGNEIADPYDMPEDEIDDVMMGIQSATVISAFLVGKQAIGSAYLEIVDAKEDPTGDAEKDTPTEGEDDEEAETPDDAADADKPATEEPKEGDDATKKAKDEERNAVKASLVASFQVPTFDSSFFSKPELDGPTKIQIDKSGRVFGHLAEWNECHVGIGNACVMAPRSTNDYALFHVSEVQTEIGPLAVGRLTIGCGHADPHLGFQPTMDHYDTAGTSWALVRAYEDQYGIAVSGIVDPGATEEQVFAGVSRPLSGDWRRWGGSLQLVAALSVNTPGYPVLSGAHDSRGRDLSLVAAGVLQVEARGPRRTNAMQRLVKEAVQQGIAEHVRSEALSTRMASVHTAIVEERRAHARQLQMRMAAMNMESQDSLSR